mgnify:CR=1 FL=1
MAKATDGSSLSLNIAVLTVSDTRTETDDTSGDYLAQALAEAFDRLGEEDRLVVRRDRSLRQLRHQEAGHHRR